MIWSTYTDDKYMDSLYLDNNGIYLLGKDGSYRTNITLNKTGGTKQKSDILLMQNDGNLVIYDECGRVAWESLTDTKCAKRSGMWHSFY